MSWCNRLALRALETSPGSRRQPDCVLDELDDADRSLGSLQNMPSNVLRVPVTFTLTCLSRAIPGFLARYPQLSLDLDLDDRRIDILKQGHDLAIRGSDSLED